MTESVTGYIMFLPGRCTLRSKISVWRNRWAVIARGLHSSLELRVEMYSEEEKSRSTDTEEINICLNAVFRPSPTATVTFHFCGTSLGETLSDLIQRQGFAGILSGLPSLQIENGSYLLGCLRHLKHVPRTGSVVVLDGFICLDGKRYWIRSLDNLPNQPVRRSLTPQKWLRIYKHEYP